MGVTSVLIEDYIEQLEKENADLKQQLQAKDKALDKACEILQECSEAIYGDGIFSDAKSRDEWKEWCENGID